MRDEQTSQAATAADAADTVIDVTPEGVPVHGPEAFEGMRRAGRLAAETLDMIADHVRPGVTTGELDARMAAFIAERGATSAPLGYAPRGLPPYPKSTCISVNHVVCHGIPGPKMLKSGNILNIDVTVVLDGWHGDSSRMYVAGEPSRKAERLIDVTHDALMTGIEAVKPGATLGDVGRAIQRFAERARCSIVTDFCGHGLGRVFHAPPSVMHYEIIDPRDPKYAEQQMPLRPGMLFTIEPMINLGRPETKILADAWTAVTRDKSLSAQFEHSIGVTEGGVEIFTQSPAGRYHPTWRR